MASVKFGDKTIEVYKDDADKAGEIAREYQALKDGAGSSDLQLAADLATAEESVAALGEALDDAREEKAALEKDKATLEEALTNQSNALDAAKAEIADLYREGLDAKARAAELEQASIDDEDRIQALEEGKALDAARIRELEEELVLAREEAKAATIQGVSEEHFAQMAKILFGAGHYLALHEGKLHICHRSSPHREPSRNSLLRSRLGIVIPIPVED